MIRIDNLNIYFKHYPEDEGISMNMLNGRELVTPYRGVTACFIQNKDNFEILAEKTSFCSVNDKFEKEAGRKVSLTKALKGFPKEFRTRVWEQYRKITTK